jgi:hypothetical protein
MNVTPQSIRRPIRGILAGVICGLVSMPMAQADFDYHVVVDTTALLGHAAGPFEIEFQLNDGSGTGDGNNSAFVGGFQFGGGSIGVSGPTAVGGVTGSLNAGSFQLSDTSFYNSVFQQFVPGTTLSFDVHQTTQADGGTTPDQFSFSILDCGHSPIPTTGPGDALFTVDIQGEPPLVQTFGGDSARTPLCGGNSIPIPPPTITVVPESPLNPEIGAVLMLAYAGLRRWLG